MPRTRTDDGLLDQGPAGYFITFTCYGTRLHGDDRGSVDRGHALPGTPFVRPDPDRVNRETERMTQPAMSLGAIHRNIVERTIIEVCAFREWDLKALNVRTNHVHAVVDAGVKPERVMNDFKVWSTRRMREAGSIDRGRNVWSRHGSTIYLWTGRDLEGACAYVLDGQGPELPGKPVRPEP